MRLFKIIFSIGLVVLAKLSFLSSAEASTLSTSQRLNNIESDFQFQNLLKKVSPVDFKVYNEKEGSMSFTK